MTIPMETAGENITGCFIQSFNGDNTEMVEENRGYGRHRKLHRLPL